MTDEQWDQFWADLGLDDDTIRQLILSSQPGMMNQSPDSTNQALLNIIADVVIGEVSIFRKIYESRQLDRASGRILEDTAADWGVSRIDDDDEFLRFQVRLARMLNQMGVTEDDLIDLIAFILQADPTEFSLVTDPEELGGDPEAIRFTNIPNKYSKSARKKNLLIKALEGAVMPEVKIVGVDFQAHAESNLFIATATSRNRQHFAVMDSQVDREHVVGDGSTMIATVTQKQRIHRIVKEG
ncbi:hypothetical protein [Levilactobacillus lindianensis]|uniref:hypothetical protein n=1 Tax=Levilactobacillus lindianensis TaxID=2486018 RepID=UPI000F744F3F|nr:hypothetical protein [Levilactobacillus lindianensis]